LGDSGLLKADFPGKMVLKKKNVDMRNAKVPPLSPLAFSSPPDQLAA
jgi:hypothetical protein